MVLMRGLENVRVEGVFCQAMKFIFYNYATYFLFMLDTHRDMLQQEAQRRKFISFYEIRKKIGNDLEKHSFMSIIP